MEDLIAIFRMEEVSRSTRIKLMWHLGRALNDKYAMNFTEDLVKELIRALSPKHISLQPEYFYGKENLKWFR